MRGGFLFFWWVLLAGWALGEVREFEFPLMGTRYAIRGEGLTEEVLEKVKKLGAEVNSACSDYDQTSELMNLNHWPAGKVFELSPILFDVLREALAISKFTDGAYDPTVGWHTWNWRKSRRDGELPNVTAIAKAKAATGWRSLVLDLEKRTVVKRVEGMRIDLGGIAKGYAADRMLGLLKERGFERVSVVAGGDLRLGVASVGAKGWVVELKTLDGEKKLVPRKVLLEGCGVSTSGDLHQWIEIGGKRFSHIVDAGTGLGLERRVSATVVARSATWSDALATALCVRPGLLGELGKLDGVEGLVVLEEVGELVVRKSVGFPVK